VVELVGFKTTSYICAEGTVLAGQKVTEKTSEKHAEWIADGSADSAVISILVGGGGLNTQKMNCMIFLGPVPSRLKLHQALGM